jgi:flavin-dependent dehydrogenase
MSNAILSLSREIPVILECDVLVLGAGMSGFAAAVTAARTGVKTVLAEKDYLRKELPQIPADPEITKRVMIKMLREAGKSLQQNRHHQRMEVA